MQEYISNYELWNIIIVLIVLALATTFSFMFFDKFDFDMVILFTGILLIFLASCSVITTYYSGLGIMIISIFLYSKLKRSESNEDI